MEEVTNWLLQNWLAIIAIIIGIIISTYFYQRGKRTKGLTHTSGDIIIISPSAEPHENLKITWEGHNIPRVTKTTIAIWNSGTETVDGADLIDTDPLRIQVPSGITILRSVVIRRTRGVVAPQLAASIHQVTVTFAFLDAKDGFSIELLHTGEPSTVQVVGTIKGIPRGVVTLDRGKWDRRVFFAILITIAISSFTMAEALVYTLLGKALLAPWPRNAVAGAITSAAVVLVWLLVKQVARLKQRDEPPRIAGVPPTLREGL